MARLRWRFIEGGLPALDVYRRTAPMVATVARAPGLTRS
jgi:hypothetical protein